MSLNEEVGTLKALVGQLEHAVARVDQEALPSVVRSPLTVFANTNRIRADIISINESITQIMELLT